MEIQSSTQFDVTYKKLHTNQRAPLARAIDAIRLDPLIGASKVGNLNQYKIYKFTCLDQLWLPAYTFDGESVITLHAVGPHENFYQKLKRSK